MSLLAEAPGDDAGLRTSRDPLQDAGSQVLPRLAGSGGGALIYLLSSLSGDGHAGCEGEG